MTDVHNQLKQATEISLAIRRMFGGDSELSVERLSETLQPVVNVWDHAYCAHLRAERPWVFGAFQAAVAAEYSAVGIRNPANSNTLLVIEGISYRAATAMGVVVAPVTTATFTGTLLGSVTEVARDRRSRVPMAIAAAGTDGNIALGATIAEYGYASTTELRAFRSVPWVVPPDSALVVTGETLNVDLWVNMYGFEKPAVPGELV